MIGLLLIILAACCKAVADCLDHGYDTSVFRKLPASFWDPNVVHKTGKQIFGYPLDAWHLFNSGMIGAFIAAAVIPETINLPGWALLIGYGVVFNIVFAVLYKILRRK
jgi:hypothetical protein